MKKFKSICLASLLGFMLSNSALAITIDGANTGPFGGTDVGDADIFKTWANLGNAGDATELNFINTIANPDLLTITKISSPQYFTTNQTNTFAIQLVDTPAYFLIKNSVYSILFENKPKAGWGVFDLEILKTISFSEEIGNSGNFRTVNLFDKFNVPDTRTWTLSHISYAGTTTDPCLENCGGGDIPTIPEPNVLSMLGIGLLGMGLSLSRRKKS